MKTVHPIFLLSLASFVAADAFNFDINDGIQKQQEAETLDADKLTYTTGGGVPSVHSISVRMAVSNRLLQCAGPVLCSANRT